MKALACFFEAFSWLNRPKLRKFIFIPLVTNLCLFIGAVYGFFFYFETVINHFLPADSWLNYLRWVLWPLLVLMLMVVVFYTFSLIANLIAAPFNGFLAEAVELLETGVPSNHNRSLTEEIWSSLKQEVRKTFFFLVRAIPFVIIMFIPAINFLAPFLWFLYAAWVNFLQYMDYPMANHGIAFTQQRQILKANPVATFGFGSAATAMMMLPGLNLLAMPVSVIGATLYWSRHIRPQIDK